MWSKKKVHPPMIKIMSDAKQNNKRRFASLAAVLG